MASPGPGIAALVARVMTADTRGIVGFVLGMIVGDLVWFTIAACGFALLVLGTVLGLYVLAADRARRAFTSLQVRRRLNQGSATVLAGAAAGIALR